MYCASAQTPTTKNLLLIADFLEGEIQFVITADTFV